MRPAIFSPQLQNGLDRFGAHTPEIHSCALETEACRIHGCYPGSVHQNDLGNDGIVRRCGATVPLATRIR